MKTIKVLFAILITVLFALMMPACQSPEVTSAKVYFQQNNVDAAEQQLLLALQKEPTNPEVSFLLATGVYAPKKDWAKSKEMLLLSKKISSTYKDPTTGLTADDMLKRIWSEVHSQGANFFNEALRALFPAEKDSLLKLAANKFQEALEIRNDQDPTYNGIVKCYYLLKDTANVVKFTRMANDAGIFDKDINFYYYQVRWTPDQQESVLSELAQATMAHPEALDLQILRIQYLTEVKRVEETMSIARQLIASDPNNVDYRFILAQILAKTGQFEEANIEYQKVLAANPDDTEALIRIAEANFNNKDWVNAEDYARKLVALDPKSIFGYEILWKSLYNQGNMGEAEKYREISKELQQQ
ncbi:MAG: tetratricopeptide repeat protein [Candidatus Marinimicrobia bacterium]|nr:tetratricopeptide repeat protein [Candidatus Neomarinimicrobiota bacterium]